MAFYWGFLPVIFGVKLCDKKDPFLRQHMNQALVLCIPEALAVVLNIAGSMIPIASIVGMLIAFVVLVFAVLGTVRAAKGSEDPAPLIGGVEFISDPDED